MEDRLEGGTTEIASAYTSYEWDTWGLRCRMFRGAYGRSCMRLVPVHLASLSVINIMPFVHFETITINIFIPMMKYKSILIPSSYSLISLPYILSKNIFTSNIKSPSIIVKIHLLYSSLTAQNHWAVPCPQDYHYYYSRSSLIRTSIFFFFFLFFPKIIFVRTRSSFIVAPARRYHRFDH